MKTQLISVLLIFSCFTVSYAQQEEKVETIESEINSSKKVTPKVKSKPALSSPEKNSGTVQKTDPDVEGPKRTEAVVKKPNEELEVEGVPEGVSTENKEVYKKTKAEWKASHPEEYKEITNSRKTIIKKEEFDKLSPERKKIILSHPEQYEITE